MAKNKLPKLNMDDNPTGCCPRFESKDWDKKVFTFNKKKFVKAKTLNFMHVPLNMGSVIQKTWKTVCDAKADSKDEFVLLSYDPSPWAGEHYFSVSKEVSGLDNVTLTGTYLTKVFEGPFSDAKKWVDGMMKYVESKGKRLKRLYFYYTTCPKCAKYYGKNYTVAFAEV